MQQNSQQPTGAVTTKQPRPVDLLKKVINSDSVQEQFQNALAENKDAFIASMIDIFTSEPKLQQCKPSAVVAECLRAATLKLPLNKSLGFAYVLPFNNNVKQPDGTWAKVMTPQFVIGYKGYKQLAMRTGKYKYINEGFVYEGQQVNRNFLAGTFTITGEPKSDQPIGYFSFFELINGFQSMLYMTLEEMARYAKRYAPTLKGVKEITVDNLIKIAHQEPKSGAVGWLGNFNDMALKTVVRRNLSKNGMMSIEMMDSADQMAHSELDAADRRQQEIEERGNRQVLDVDYQEAAEIKDDPRPTQEEAPQVQAPTNAPY